MPRKQTGKGSVRGLVCVQLMEHWNFWPQTLQSSEPQPDFLSSLTSTDFSWLQKRHVKVVGSGSRWQGQEKISARSRLEDGAGWDAAHSVPSLGPGACWSSCACPLYMMLIEVCRMKDADCCDGFGSCGCSSREFGTAVRIREAFAIRGFVCFEGEVLHCICNGHAELRMRLLRA